MDLPKPKSKFGYSNEEIAKICQERGIGKEAFNKAFGVNTVGVEIVDGKKELRLYACDVERAFWNLDLLKRNGRSF